jgi:hypothetical protein
LFLTIEESGTPQIVKDMDTNWNTLPKMWKISVTDPEPRQGSRINIPDPQHWKNWSRTHDRTWSLAAAGVTKKGVLFLPRFAYNIGTGIIYSINFAYPNILGTDNRNFYCWRGEGLLEYGSEMIYYGFDSGSGSGQQFWFWPDPQHWLWIRITLMRIRMDLSLCCGSGCGIGYRLLFDPDPDSDYYLIGSGSKFTAWCRSESGFGS